MNLAKHNFDENVGGICSDILGWNEFLKVTVRFETLKKSWVKPSNYRLF